MSKAGSRPILPAPAAPAGLRDRFRTLAHLPRLLASLWRTSPGLCAVVMLLRCCARCSRCWRSMSAS